MIFNMKSIAYKVTKVFNIKIWNNKEVLLSNKSDRKKLIFSYYYIKLKVLISDYKHYGFEWDEHYAYCYII